jgi:intracellular septation protein
MSKAAAQKKEPKWIKGLTEYVPILLFLIAYYTTTLMFAIQVIVVATGIALVIALVVARRVPVLPLVTAALVMAFGGAAWALGDDAIYKMKPTIMQTLFGVGLLSGLPFGRYFMRDLAGDAWEMVDAGWRRLTIEYSLLFFVLAAANEVVWRTQSETFWVNFKVFGMIGAIVVFTVVRSPMIARYAPDSADDEE